MPILLASMSQNAILHYLFGPGFMSNLLLHHNDSEWLFGKSVMYWKVNNIICPIMYHISQCTEWTLGKKSWEEAWEGRLSLFYKWGNWPSADWQAQVFWFPTCVLFPQCSTASKEKDLTANVDALEVSII